MLEEQESTQKYLLCVSDEMYDAVINNKFKQYVGSIIASTTNPDTGEKPTFGQLPQGSITPHIEMMRLLATQFSAATGLSVTDTGVIIRLKVSDISVLGRSTQGVTLMRTNNGKVVSMELVKNEDEEKE